MIFKCRDIPLIEYKSEVSIDAYEQILRQRNMRGQFTKENVFVICPLDFSQTEFDEESGNLISSSKTDENCAIVERAATHTLLSVIDSATALEKEIGQDNKTQSVVDENSSPNADAVKRILERLRETATPYECYTIAITQARKKETEEKTEENGEQKSLPTAQKRYTHHDPATERPVVAAVSSGIEGVIDLSDEACEKARSSFADSQLQSKKELKRARKTARKNVDISTELPKEEGPSHTAKRIKKDDKAEGVPSYTVNHIKVDDEDEETESFDYSKFDKNAFSESHVSRDLRSSSINNPRIENKKTSADESR
ncbi:hypothetical protein OSTOST_26148 [Ostertagia ostertagi]